MTEVKSEKPPEAFVRNLEFVFIFKKMLFRQMCIQLFPCR